MVYPYHVKHNGVNYAPFEEIPDDCVTPVVTDATESEKPIVETVAYSKTEINRMPIVELKKISKEQGIENVDSKSGAELKKNLIEKFGL